MDIEAHVATLEVDMSSLKIDVAVVRSNYTTKQDLLEFEARLQRELHALTWRIYRFGAVLVAALYFAARSVHCAIA